MPVPKAPPPSARPPAVAAVTPETSTAPAEIVAVASATPKAVAVNDFLPFLAFVEHHPVGSSVNAVVESYSSHGAYVRVGDVKGYVPLRLMADPAPRSAREFMKIGDAVTLVVESFAPARRSIDLAVAGMATAKLIEAPPAKVTKSRRRRAPPLARGTGRRVDRHAGQPAKAAKATKATQATKATKPAAKKATAKKPAATKAIAKKATTAKKAASTTTRTGTSSEPAVAAPAARPPIRGQARQADGQEGGCRRGRTGSDEQATSKQTTKREATASKPTPPSATKRSSGRRRRSRAAERLSSAAPAADSIAVTSDDAAPARRRRRVH